MISVFAVVALAGLSAFATAAPLGSPPYPIRIVSPVWETPIDPGLNSPAVTGQIVNGSTDAPSLPPSRIPVAAAAFSTGTLIAFSAVFLVSRRSLRRGRRRRARRYGRIMAII